jgi:hypothetical protein
MRKTFVGPPRPALIIRDMRPGFSPIFVGPPTREQLARIEKGRLALIEIVARAAVRKLLRDGRLRSKSAVASTVTLTVTH